MSEPPPSDTPSAHGTTPSGPALSRLRAEQRQRWQQGQRVLVESYLERQPQLQADTEAVLDLIYNEVMLRQEQGETIPLEEYQKRFPHLAAPLKDLFDVHQALEESGATAPEDVKRDAAEPASTNATVPAGTFAPAPVPESPPEPAPVGGAETLSLLSLPPKAEPAVAADAVTELLDGASGPRNARPEGTRSETTVVDQQVTPSAEFRSQPAESARKEWPRIEGYEIVGQLGRGGMGIVYKAHQLGLNRIVALKMLLSGAYADADLLRRFRAEAEAVAQFQHPNIVQIYDVGEQDGRAYFSLEFVDGGSLSQKIAGSPQPPRPAAQLVERLARAVHAAHQRGIIHRDLKPANILLASLPPRGKAGDALSGTPRPKPSRTLETSEVLEERFYGVPKITDFGLAKKLDQSGGYTQSGVAMGTPSYMAPEQAQGRQHDIGPATDVYGLGAILYEMLTGRPPFEGPTAMDIVLQVVNEDAVPPTRFQAKVPRDLETICLKCLHKEPVKRYASAEALAEDLRAFLAGEPIQARPAGAGERALKWARRRPAVAVLLGAGALVVLSLLVGGWLYNVFALSGIAVVSLLAGAWWYNARLQTALQALAEQHVMAERHVERLHLLLETTHRLMSARDLDSLLSLIGRTTTRLANADRATIYLIDRERKELWSKVALGENVGEIRVPLGVGIAGTVAVSGETINIPDAYADPRFNPEIDQRTGYRTHNMLTFPMRSQGGHILGVFQILNKRGGGFGADDVETLGALAASAAVAIENAQRG